MFFPRQTNRFFEMFLMKRYLLRTPLILCCCVCFSFDLKADVSFTFTNCGQSGKNGPSGTQITAAYVGTALKDKSQPDGKPVTKDGSYLQPAHTGLKQRALAEATRQKRRWWNYSPR